MQVEHIPFSPGTIRHKRKLSFTIREMSGPIAEIILSSYYSHFYGAGPAHGAGLADMAQGPREDTPRFIRVRMTGALLANKGSQILSIVKRKAKSGRELVNPRAAQAHKANVTRGKMPSSLK